MYLTGWAYTIIDIQLSRFYVPCPAYVLGVFPFTFGGNESHTVGLIVLFIFRFNVLMGRPKLMDGCVILSNWTRETSQFLFYSLFFVCVCIKYV